MRSRWFPGLVVVMVLSAGPAAAQQGVEVRDNAFSPATATVTSGGTVTWTQSGTNPHTVTADDGSFDSHPQCPPDCMGEGETFTRTFDSPGDVGYYCKLHGGPGQGMAGVVTVQAAAQQTPAEEPAADDTSTPDDAQQPAAATGDGDDGARTQELAATGLGMAPLAALAAVLLLVGGLATTRSRARRR